MPDKEKNVDMTFRQSETILKEDVDNWRKKPASDPFLVILSGIEKGKKILLVSSKTSLGRSVGCNIQVKDNRVSRTHAIIFRKEGDFSIEDQNSSNGTQVNNSKIAGFKNLKTGDLITLGATEMMLTIPEKGK